jgi:hypothetical protein
MFAPGASPPMVSESSVASKTSLVPLAPPSTVSCVIVRDVDGVWKYVKYEVRSLVAGAASMMIATV